MLRRSRSSGPISTGGARHRDAPQVRGGLTAQQRDVSLVGDHHDVCKPAGSTVTARRRGLLVARELVEQAAEHHRVGVGDGALDLFVAERDRRRRGHAAGTRGADRAAQEAPAAVLPDQLVVVAAQGGQQRRSPSPRRTCIHRLLAVRAVAVDRDRRIADPVPQRRARAPAGCPAARRPACRGSRRARWPRPTCRSTSRSTRTAPRTPACRGRPASVGTPGAGCGSPLGPRARAPSCAARRSQPSRLTSRSPVPAR